MAQQRRGDTWVITLYLLLIAASGTLFWFGVNLYQNAKEPKPTTVLGLGTMSVILVVALYPIAIALRQIAAGAAGDNGNAELLKSINDRLAASDMNKRIASRVADREAIRKAIIEDIQKRDFDSAMALAEEMGAVYGYRHEAEEYREQIQAARAAETDRRITEAVAGFQQTLVDHDFEKATAEAAKLQRLYPDSLRTRDLPQQVIEAHEAFKHDLERQFLQAKEVDDIEKAMELLKTLDKHLTEQEAAPLREIARDVIGKKRQNLGVQFKMAVHDKEWSHALRIAEQIIREFPNSKMAEEIRVQYLDQLRARAAGEQDARPQPIQTAP